MDRDTSNHRRLADRKRNYKADIQDNPSTPPLIRYPLENVKKRPKVGYGDKSASADASCLPSEPSTLLDPYSKLLGSPLPSPFASPMEGSTPSPAPTDAEMISQGPAGYLYSLAMEMTDNEEPRSLDWKNILNTEIQAFLLRASLPLNPSCDIEFEGDIELEGDIDMMDVCSEDDSSNKIVQNPTECDTCLGMLRISVLNSQGFRDVRKGIPATLSSPFGLRSLMVTTEFSHVGMVDGKIAQGILKVMSLYPSVELDAFIPKLQPEKTCLWLHVDVYGASSQLKDIGRSFSQERLYLQSSPRNTKRLQYENPHTLQISQEAQSILREMRGGTAKKVNVKVRNLEKEEDEISKIFESESNALHFSEDICVSERILTKLMDHQKEALSFMRIKELHFVSDKVPSLWTPVQGAHGTTRFVNKIDNGRSPTLPRNFGGGILADEMGLGKSLTMLSLIATSLDSHFYTTTRRTTLIIAPKSTLVSWDEQINRHTKNLTMLRYASKSKQDPDFGQFDIVLTTFGVVASEAKAGWISSFPWRRIVLDEAHTIRRRSTKQAKAICGLNSERRWCLTGTPIQNNLDDFGSLLQFLQVSPVHTKADFSNHVMKPLQAGDPIAFHKLRQIVSATTLRRTKAKTLASVLPERNDEVHLLSFNGHERNIYQLLNKHALFWIDKELKSVNEPGAREKGSSRRVTQLLLRLRQVCDHGAALLPVTLIKELDLFKKGEPIEKFNFSTRCEICGTDDDDMLDSGIEMANCQHLVCRDCLLLDESVTQGDICPLCSQVEASAEQEDPDLKQPEILTLEACESNNFPPSTKVLALLQNLKKCRSEKSVVFSCWTKMLDLVASAFKERNILFERLDGSMKLAERKRCIENFQSNDKIRVLLATIGSASVGIDLTAASRIHMLEPQFNPMTEEQALARVHRIGQTHRVVTVRYIMEDSYEERIQSLQRKKIKLAELCSGVLNSSARSSVEMLKSIKEVLK